MKLVLKEVESVAFRRWSEGQDALLISRLGVVELQRAVMRANGRLDQLEPVLEFLDVMPLSEAILQRAGSIGAPSLRALDAVHVASALAGAAATRTFATYDRRQAEAAEAMGLDVVSPS